MNSVTSQYNLHANPQPPRLDELVDETLLARITTYMDKNFSFYTEAKALTKVAIKNIISLHMLYDGQESAVSSFNKDLMMNIESWARAFVAEIYKPISEVTKDMMEAMQMYNFADNEEHNQIVAKV